MEKDRVERSGEEREITSAKNRKTSRARKEQRQQCKRVTLESDDLDSVLSSLYLLAVWSWASYLTSLSLSSLIRKMETIRISSSQSKCF